MYEYNEVWSNIFKKIKEQSDSLVVDFNKSILTINFDTEDNIPLNEMLIFNSLITLIARVSKIDSKFYQKVFLNNAITRLKIINRVMKKCNYKC